MLSMWCPHEIPSDHPRLCSPGDSDPSRPWWAPAEISGDGYYNDISTQWTRRDGWTLNDNGYEWSSSPPLGLYGEVEDIKGKNPQELMAKIDATHPLPPVVLRAGQIWLLESSDGECHTAVLNSILWEVLRGYPQGVSTYGQWILGGRVLTNLEAEMLLILGKHPTVKAYLLVDPVSPLDAPWMPPGQPRQRGRNHERRALLCRQPAL